MAVTEATTAHGEKHQDGGWPLGRAGSGAGLARRV